jgi:response regulator RpfG family c-di-GMP phosphodiesterase
VYKQPWDESDVLAYLRDNSGKLFDPSLVKLFFTNFSRFRDITDQHPDKFAEPEFP